MNIDELLSYSFILDYEILKNNTFNDKLITTQLNFLNPKLKSNDFFKEFEDYIKNAKENFIVLSKTFEDCNEQRKVK